MCDIPADNGDYSSLLSLPPVGRSVLSHTMQCQCSCRLCTQRVCLCVSHLLECCVQRSHLYTAMCLFSLAVATRSNGVVLAGYIVYHHLLTLVHSQDCRTVLRTVGHMAIQVSVIFLPLVCFQVHGYMTFCTSKTHRELHSSSSSLVFLDYTFFLLLCPSSLLGAGVPVLLPVETVAKLFTVLTNDAAGGILCVCVLCEVCRGCGQHHTTTIVSAHVHTCKDRCTYLFTILHSLALIVVSPCNSYFHTLFT